MFPRPPLTPVVKVLLIGLFSAFVTQIVLERFVGLDLLTLLGISSRTPITPFVVAQFFTHVVVNSLHPSSLIWILIGFVFLWWVGAPFELRVGAKQTWIMTAIAAVASGVGTFVAGFVLPGYAFGLGPILDAMIVGFAVTLPPNAQLLFFGVAPMRRNGLIGLLIAFVVLSNVIDTNYAGLVGDLACIGASYAYMLWLLKPRRPKPRRETQPKKAKRRNDHGFRVIQGGGEGDDDDDDRPRWLN